MRTGTAKIFFIMLSVAALWIPCAQAADMGAQFGVLYGFSVPDLSDTNSYHLFGVKGEAFLNPAFSIGGYYLVSDKSGQMGSNKFTYSLHGIETAYHFPGATGDTFIAFRVGLTKIHAAPSNTDVIYSPYHYGVACGYDYLVKSWLMMGFEGSYLHIENGKSTVSNQTFLEDSFNIINFMVSLQFRF
jgi:hypothetical protein